MFGNRILSNRRQPPPTNLQLNSGRLPGIRFVQASEQNPQAWNTALDFLSYRTVENAQLVAVGTAQQIATTPVDINLTVHYKFQSPAGYTKPTLTVGGDVPSTEAAQLRLLQEPVENLPRGKQVILVQAKIPTALPSNFGGNE